MPLPPLAWKARWLLEDQLKGAGADYTAGLPLRSKVVVDRNLYTGQNPAPQQRWPAASFPTSPGTSGPQTLENPESRA